MPNLEFDCYDLFLDIDNHLDLLSLSLMSQRGLNFDRFLCFQFIVSTYVPLNSLVANNCMLKIFELSWFSLFSHLLLHYYLKRKTSNMGVIDLTPPLSLIIGIIVQDGS